MFRTSGKFLIGCNYWGSHAGTHTWRDWRPEVIADDLRLLEEAGVQVIRVFPLWPDFQPLTQLYQCMGEPVEMRFGEQLLPDDELGNAGMSLSAMEHFRFLCDEAEKRHIQVLVGIVTGWMSGRWFVPVPFETKNVLTDPVVLQWELRFVKTFVRYFKDHPAIKGWDLGNECNCLARLNSPQQAYVWTSLIVDAIRSVDTTRPVVSGMHSLSPAKGNWLIADQGELCDVLTTHPYPRFTPWCDLDPLTTCRPSLHAVAESLLYADLGGRPCLVEEIGTLGSIYGNEETAAAYIRQVLFNSWAADLRGLLWWCGFEQIALEQPPYDWHGVERELGMFHLDKTPKPLVGVYQDFRRFIDSLPFDQLPKRRTDAVCIVSADQDQWGVAYASYILARQAGGDLTFFDGASRHALPESPLYLLPGIAGGGFLTRHRWFELMERVSQGATLYLSLDDAVVSEIAKVMGADVLSRSKRTAASRVEFDATLFPGVEATAPAGSIRLEAVLTEATALAREADGNPIVTELTYGKGRIVCVAIPVETQLCKTPGAFHGPTATAYWKVYQWLFRAHSERLVTKTLPCVMLTEHPFADGRCAVVAVNASPAPVIETLNLADGWHPTATLRGVQPAQRPDGSWQIEMPANDAVVFMIAQ